VTFEQIISDLKKKIYYPVYLLTGEESYYIDRISDFIENNVLTEEEKEFNQSIIYGRDVDVPTIISYAKRFPMMSNYQVVIVKEAQDLDKPKPKMEELVSYVENPLSSTILVLNYKYKKVDKRKKFAKLIAKKGVFFESKKLYDNQVQSWITNYIQNKNLKITPKASALLAEYLGTDLGKIANEVGKLTINLKEGEEINDILIEKNIGISKDYNIFELQKALAQRDIVKANRIANYFAANPKDNPIVKTIIILYNYFSSILLYHRLKDKSRNNVAAKLGINPFFVKDYEIAARNYNIAKVVKIISYLREYDLKSKGVDNISATDGELLKELLFKILH